MRPERALVVEDSLNGIRAAKAAGMTAVLVPNASIPPAPGARELADLTVERLADIEPLVTKEGEGQNGARGRARDA